MLLIFIGMELDDIRYLAVTKSFQALPGFSIPEFHLTIITTRKEQAPIVGETKIFYSFCMAIERAQTVSVCVDIPKLERVIYINKTIELY